MNRLPLCQTFFASHLFCFFASDLFICFFIQSLIIVLCFKAELLNLIKSVQLLGEQSLLLYYFCQVALIIFQNVLHCPERFAIKYPITILEALDSQYFNCKLSYAFISFCRLSYACYMLLKAKVSEQQEEEQEMLHLCLTGFYLRKPVKIHFLLQKN